MNGLRAAVAEFEAIKAQGAAFAGRADQMICPPATLVARLAEAARGSDIIVGGQDCHAQASGAFTGDISAEMLADAGARSVIVGHSERRTAHRETDAEVRAKTEAAGRAGLIAVVCIGETQAERQSGKTLDVLGRQLDGSLPDGISGDTLVVAYEPVWAIGTGLTPTAADVAEAHRFIRERIAQRHGAEASRVRLLYGGSVKPGNAAELMAVPDVDGALVGGASLKAADFFGIVAAYK